MSQKVKHKGTVVSIGENTIEVKITSISACVSCQNSKNCGMSDMKDKIVSAVKPDNPAETFLVGEEVEVLVEQKKALLAVLLTYFVPTLLLITSLFVFSDLLSETAAALLSLTVVALYFLAFLFFKPLLNKSFQISIHKKESSGKAFTCNE